VRQASRQVVAEPAIEKLGKQVRDEIGKHPVNEDAEESLQLAGIVLSRVAHASMIWPTCEE
jgi:hypothetical protein